MMDDKANSAEEGKGAMHKRRTTLEDGRYLIYYTFGDEAGPRAAFGADDEPEPEAAPEATEERSV